MRVLSHARILWASCYAANSPGKVNGTIYGDLYYSMGASTCHIYMVMLLLQHDLVLPFGGTSTVNSPYCTVLVVHD